MNIHAQPAFRQSSTSLQTLMGVFILFIILAVISLNGRVVYHSYQRTLQTAESAADNLSVSLSRHAEDTILQVELLLQEINERIEQDGFGGPQLLRLQQVLKNRRAKLPQLSGIFIYDAAGHWLVTSNETIPKNANNSDRDYFKHHQNNNGTKLHIGSVIQSRSTGELVIPISMRLNNQDGSFAGVLLATVAIDYFKHYYSYYSLGTTDVLAILLSDGHILYGRPFDDSQINRDVSNSPLFNSELKTSESGRATFVSAVDHVERIYGYTRLKRYPIVIAAGVNRAEILSNWKTDSTIYTAITLTLLLLISGMGWLVLRQINVNIKSQHDLTRVRDQLTAVNHTLETLALLDGLTGLANRRQFDIFLQETILQSAATGKKMALIMMDIDMFKKYNDHYGHVEGDKCLQSISNVLSNIPRRKEDLIARYGGEEFVIILLDTSVEGATSFAQRALDAIRERQIPHIDTLRDEKIVTASAGVYVFVGSEATDAAEHAIRQADRALYQAKHAGRNCIIATSQEEIAQAG